MPRTKGRPKQPRQPNLQHENCRSLVKKFCKEEALKSGNINWGREIKIAKLLLARQPIEFWNGVNLGFQLNSLAWFLTPKGLETIDAAERLNKLELPQKQVYNLDTVVAPSLEAPQQETPKTLFDFLRK